MRFAFAGIDFLGQVFDALVEAGWEPVRLFTRPCDGIYDTNDAIVARAKELCLPVQLSRITPSDLKALGAAGCETLVVAGYPWLVRGWRLNLAYGLNIHPSPLPIGRGPYPLFRAILDDYESWGVTAHVLDDTFDTGPIIAREDFPTAPDETHDSLLAKCQLAAGRLARDLAHDLPRLWREAEPQGEGSYWPRITDPERTLDWSKGVEAVLRTVRALGSVESIAKLGAATTYVRAASGWHEEHGHKPGTLVHSYRRHLVIAASDGYVQLTAWSPVSIAAARDLGR